LGFFALSNLMATLGGDGTLDMRHGMYILQCVNDLVLRDRRDRPVRNSEGIVGTTSNTPRLERHWKLRTTETLVDKEHGVQQ